MEGTDGWVFYGDGATGSYVTSQKHEGSSSFAIAAGPGATYGYAIQQITLDSTKYYQFLGYKKDSAGGKISGVCLNDTGFSQMLDLSTNEWVAYGAPTWYDSSTSWKPVSIVFRPFMTGDYYLFLDVWDSASLMTYFDDVSIQEILGVT
jgi:hypothetical protein